MSDAGVIAMRELLRQLEVVEGQRDALRVQYETNSVEWAETAGRLKMERDALRVQRDRAIELLWEDSGFGPACPEDQVDTFLAEMEG